MFLLRKLLRVQIRESFSRETPNLFYTPQKRIPFPNPKLVNTFVKWTFKSTRSRDSKNSASSMKSVCARKWKHHCDIKTQNEWNMSEKRSFFTSGICSAPSAFQGRRVWPFGKAKSCEKNFVGWGKNCSIQGGKDEIFPFSNEGTLPPTLEQNVSVET